MPRHCPRIAEVNVGDTRPRSLNCTASVEAAAADEAATAKTPTDVLKPVK